MVSAATPIRHLDAARVREAVARLCVTANRHIPPAMRASVHDAIAREASPTGRAVLQSLVENYDAAAADGVPICQDTGLAIVLVELGQALHIDGDLTTAIAEGVALGYREGFLRASVVSHPLDRVNTGDNTPPTIHLTLVPGDTLRIVLLPKGGGCENASAVRMLKPADGADGVARFVVDHVAEHGVNACPPLVVGVGLGGNFEGCALLAKHALLRPLGRPSDDPRDAALEADILGRVNALGIGPAGYGGTVTALAVHVASAPCHIASLPCAVNLQCNAHRLAEVIL